ncbi:MAG: RNA 3'-terminal phosphate cyclase [Candidatus Thermoplasmatota archaeon]|nr:RNA 3'-terminal phosphate cyclase [Candidatus Thermoplasmatota archaeon]
MIEIDGSHGEGGGQILRMAVALSALTGSDVKIRNIRAGRPNPGLRRQHMIAIESVRKICNGKVNGLHENSLEIEFFSGDMKGGTYSFDIGTAGSITLVFQACILPSLFAENETIISLKGGTDVRWSPPWDYFNNVFLKLLRRMGISADGKLYRRGYYPKGGGMAEIAIKPCRDLHPINFGTEEELKIEGIVNIANLPLKIAERMRNAAEKEFREKEMETDITISEGDSSSPGIGIVLWTADKKILGSDSLGKKGRPAEQVGREAASTLLDKIESGADIDRWAVDQILPYAAISGKPFSFRCMELSGHAETEMWLLEKFLDVKFGKKVSNKLIELVTIPKECKPEQT